MFQRKLVKRERVETCKAVKLQRSVLIIKHTVKFCFTCW